MSELKELLKELQATDTELRQSLSQKKEIPAKVEKLESEIAELHKRFEEIKTALTNARKDMKMAELNLAEQEEAVTKYSTQLYSAKTNEEYKAFLKEIETAKRKKSEAEDKIIELMEQIEKDEAELAESEKKRDAEEDVKKKEIEGIKTRVADIDKKIESIKDKYDRLRNEMPEDMIEIYDRICNNKEGIAVAQITEDGRCSVCLNPVPAQKSIEATHSDHMIFCEYCGRILIP